MVSYSVGPPCVRQVFDPSLSRFCMFAFGSIFIFDKDLYFSMTSSHVSSNTISQGSENAHFLFFPAASHLFSFILLKFLDSCS